MNAATTESRLLDAIAKMDGTCGAELGLIDMTELGLGWYWEVISVSYDGEVFDECGLQPTLIEAVAEIFDLVHPFGRDEVYRY